jgi:hypothetical protein
MAEFSRSTSDESRFVKTLREEIERTLPSQFVVPVRASDPDTSDPTNLWMRADGRLRGRYWNGAAFVYVDYPMRSDITAPPAVPAYPALPAVPSQPVTRVGTYTATWSQTYQASGAKRTDTRGENFLVYGNEGNAYGTQRALIGFNYALINSDLASSTIKSIQLKLQNVASYWNTGVDIFFGMHNVTSEPLTWPATGFLPLRRVVQAHLGPVDYKTIQLQMQFAQLLRTGGAKGIAIEAPTNARDYFGTAAGFGSGYSPPQLIITYIK